MPSIHRSTRRRFRLLAAASATCALAIAPAPVLAQEPATTPLECEATNSCPPPTSPAEEAATVTAVRVNGGSARTGSVITVRGTNFSGVTQLTVGTKTVPLRNIVVLTHNVLMAWVPPMPKGTYPLSVWALNGYSLPVQSQPSPGAVYVAR